MGSTSALAVILRYTPHFIPAFHKAICCSRHSPAYKP
jgi:hypothetical protein